MPPRARPSGPLAHKELRETLDYNPETGWLTWKVRRSRIQKGARAGGQHGKGHRALIVAGFGFLEHRLIWFWMTGALPPKERYIDHKNRKSDDNRWCNLRLATHGQNYVNSKVFGRMRGIMKRGENSYRVRVNDGQGRRLSFTAHSYLAARRLRNRLEKQYWGEFACARR